MAHTKPKSVIIIGNGVAGITAARYIRKQSDHRITVISDETDHFFSRTALMYIYMGHMKYEDTKPYEDWFWEKNRINLRRGYVSKLHPKARSVELSHGERIPYDTLIVATGSKSNRFGWSGENLAGVQGLYSIEDLNLMQRSTAGIRHGVVVGGGLIGVEMAEMLHSRGIDVTMLVRERSWMDHVLPPEESAMVAEAIGAHGIDLRLATELDHIDGDAAGRARAVVTQSGDRISTEFVGLTVGVSPKVSFDHANQLQSDRGILVDSSLRTNLPDVYAIGDCAQLRVAPPGRRPIEPLWYVARRMGQTVARTVCGDETVYDPGIWFNSAKFFDLEYQVYGDVPSKLPESMGTLFWRSTEGTKAIRINYGQKDGRVKGFNLLGIRYRHELCDAWIRDGRDIRFVLTHLGAANFDPELYPQHERDLVAQYNQRNPNNRVSLRAKRGLRSLFRAHAAPRESQ